MDFKFSEEQETFREEVREFLRQECRIDEDGTKTIGRFVNRVFEPIDS